MKTTELNPNKNYIFGYHPHGIMSAGAFISFGTDSCGFAQVFPGVRPTLVVLAGLFKIPIFREYLMSGGMFTVIISLSSSLKRKLFIGGILTFGTVLLLPTRSLSSQ